jgi:electron-transferring-flavoprotein dehydrogenase
MSPDNDRIQYDLLLVGASPSNLILAHRLVQLAKDSGQAFNIAILDKAREFGGHIVSGAVSKPHVIKKVFPNWEELGFPIEGICKESHFSMLGADKKWDVPAFATPSGFKKHGYFILSLSLVVAWLVQHLEAVIADVPNVTIDFFPGFAAHEVVYEGNKVAGVRVAETGMPSEDNIYADVTVFGDKGFLSQDIIKKFDLRNNPQLWSVGVKEVWEVPGDYTGKVWHTMGYPVLDGTFGGGFVYGMKNNRLTIGLIISLDSPNPNINPQQRLQDMKKHPWIQSMIREGRLVKYGAALLPEGGYYSLPTQFAVDGAMLVGDALGVLNVTNLAGIDASMESGYQAAEVLHQAFAKKDFSAGKLNQVKARLEDTFVIKDLYKSRYFRMAFMENPRLLRDYLPRFIKAVDNGNPLLGGPLSVALAHPATAPVDAIAFLSNYLAIADRGPIRYKACHEHIQPDYPLAMTPTAPSAPVEKSTIYSREDAVFYAYTKYHEGNQHIDEFKADVCVACIAAYDALGRQTPCVSDCTAEVHRVDEMDNQRRHGMSLENCIQCRTCEIVCPHENLRVNAAYEGSGPDFLGL